MPKNTEFLKPHLLEIKTLRRIITLLEEWMNIYKNLQQQEEIYQNLVKSFENNEPESIHHCQYPQFTSALYDEKLSRAMDLVVDIVSRVLSIRETKQIRVRQPLKTLIVLVNGEVVDNWECINCFIKSVNFEELDYSASDAVSITLEIVYDSAQMLHCKTSADQWLEDMKSKRLEEMELKRAAGLHYSLEDAISEIISLLDGDN